MVKTHKVKYIHLKRGSKRNIQGCIALVYISVDTKLFFWHQNRYPTIRTSDIRIFHFKSRPISLFFQVSLLDMVGLDGMDTFRKLRSTKPVVDPSDTVTVQWITFL